MPENQACANHPENAAVELCEVCGTPLCGACLWYDNEGHRLCELHAKEREMQGRQVYSPNTYAEAIDFSLEPSSFRNIPAGRSPDGVYNGNNNDLYGLIAAAAGVSTLMICSGFGTYCLPIFALVLGIVAYQQANTAVDGQRTRNLALLGIVSGGLVTLLFVGFVGCYLLLILFAIFSSGGFP